MTTITLEVPETLAEQLAQLGDRLPEILMVGLREATPLPAHVYRYILDFLASGPTPEQVAAFRPTPEMQARLEILLARSRAGQLTPAEVAELDEYERIEHLIVMLKAGNLPHLTGAV
jgi:hypothetical protein